MAIIYTFHGEPKADWAGHRTDALPAQIGDQVAVADGAASAALPAGLYRIFATGDSLVRWDSASLTNGSGGMPLLADDWVIAYINEDRKIGCSAYA